MPTTDAPEASPDVLLHGAWVASEFHLWGTRRDPSHSADKPRVLTPAELHEIVGSLSADGLLSAACADSTLSLRLPHDQDGPVLAPLLSTSAADAAARPQPEFTLRGFKAPSLAFAPADSTDLLASLPADKSSPSAGTLGYWAVLARYALSVIARRQFSPDIREKPDGKFEASWRLLVHDRRELSWLERVAAAMPPVCRAPLRSGEDGVDQAKLIDGFLAALADAVIRRTLSNDEFFRQIHDRAAREKLWELRLLSSLIGNDPGVRAAPEDNAAGAAQVHAWLAQSDEGAGEGPPQLSFTLVEPEGEPAPSKAVWHVRFDLCSADTGQRLDLAGVWSEPADAPTILGRHLHGRREHLLAELARAAEVFPEIRKALSAGSPTSVPLTTSGAHQFLRERAPLLSAQGFEVELPDWATATQRKLGLQLTVSPRDESTSANEVSIGSLGLSSLLDFNWRVAVGDARLSLDEFESLAEQKTPLVKIHGQWVGIDNDSAEKALDFMRKRAGGKLTLAEALRLASGAEDLDTGLPIVGLEGTSWVEQLLSESPLATIQTFDAPADFNGTLRPYQLRGVHWLAFLDSLGIGACLADDMGLGKTIQLIALLLHERRGGATVGPTILFAPMSVVGNWEREIQRFAKSLRVLIHHGPERLSGDSFVLAANSHDVILTTYGLANRELADLRRVNWHRIALDEAQKIKNPSANQTIALRNLPGAHRVALTGTPLENHLSELWSIMEMLNPGLLGSAASFRTRFAVPVEKLGDQARADQLRRMIRPFLLRRLKSDPAVACDLPEKMEMRVFCNLTPEQAALYQQTVQRMLGEIENSSGIRRRGLILAALTRLKQVCNHPLHLLREPGPLDGRSGKCERLVEMLEEVMEEGDAALVFTQYREMGVLLERLLVDRLRAEVLFLHGGTTMKNRNKMILQFQDPASSNRIFLLSLKAGGFGLNLTKANHVFHFDRWWNPAVEDQATDRAHRIGQTRRVQVHKFVCIGTVEDRIDKLLTEKAALADRIVGSGDEWLTGLSTTELRDYLTLGKDAVAED